MATRAGLNFDIVVTTAINLADKNGLENLTLVEPLESLQQAWIVLILKTGQGEEP